MKATSVLSDFFMGKLYPIFISALVLFGYFCELEFVSASVIVVLLSIQLFVCDSIRPAFLTVITFIFQVPLAHTPAIPTFSDYLFTEWRLVVVISLAALVAGALSAFVIRRRLWRRLSAKKIKILPALLLFALALLCNGFLSDSWSVAGLALGAAEGAFYLALFLVFYLGLSENESEGELLDYITYIALLVSAVILLQMADLFLFGEAIVDGAIKKENVTLGWATCNPLGAILVTLIPLLFYGAMNKRDGLLYFVAATMVYVAAICTCSRNALLFGTLVYAVCLFIAAVGSQKKWQRAVFSIVIGVGILAVGAALVVFREKILLLFDSFVKQGVDDNGRFYLWGIAWREFLDNLLFGGGFFGLEDSTVVIALEGMPIMAHNTFLQVLATSGIFGIVAYLYYRAETIRPLVEKPTLGKTMLGLSYLVIAIASLLDVFVFGFYMMFLPIIAQAVTYRIYEMQCDTSGRD